MLRPSAPGSGAGGDENNSSHYFSRGNNSHAAAASTATSIGGTGAVVSFRNSLLASFSARGLSESQILSRKYRKAQYPYWYFLAFNYQYIVVIWMAVAGLITRYVYNDVRGYLLAGSIISLLAEFAVLRSYMMVKPWRQHPSKLLINRTVSNIILSATTAANAIRAAHLDDLSSENSSACGSLSFWTEFAFFAGECWFFVVSLDLILSISNPFMSFKENYAKYRICIWIASIAISYGLVFNSSCHGAIADGLCWFHVENGGFWSPCFIGYVLVWILLFYSFSVGTIIYVLRRMKRGLESSYETRRVSIQRHITLIITCLFYVILVAVFYAFLVHAEGTEHDGNSYADKQGARILMYGLALLLGSRGLVDSILWFRIQRVNLPVGVASPEAVRGAGDRIVDWTRYQSIPSQIVSYWWKRARICFASESNQRDTCIESSAPLLSNDSGSLVINKGISVNRISESQSANRPSTGDVTLESGQKPVPFRTWSGTAAIFAPRDAASDIDRQSWNERPSSMMGYMDTLAVTAGEDDENSVLDDEEEVHVDLSLNPQLNLALRKEVLTYVTNGIIRSLEHAQFMKDLENPQADDSSVFWGSPAGKKRSTPIPAPSLQTPPGEEFRMDAKHSFRDWYPLQFQKLRSLSGITEEWYAKQISMPAQEQLSEGASGAFMFFCGSGEFMVKTISSSERDVLASILPKYVDHFQRHPKSLLVRFLGMHELRMYSQTFYFVVMKNIFPKTASINMKFDIKGSWINRSGSSSMPPGTKTFCKHCGELFRVGATSTCPQRVGDHEPNLVLKDNDLTSKIRMRPEQAFDIIDTLHRDSDALCQMGITDYSLLVGVRNISYEVEPEVVIAKRRHSFAAFKEREASESGRLSFARGTSQSASLVDVDDADTAAVPGGVSNGIPRLSEETCVVSGAQPPSLAGSRASLSNAQQFPNPGLENSDQTEFAGGYLARAVIAPGVYYFGVVDILQKWTLEKKLEKAWKVHVRNLPEEGISCMPPEPYRDRFQKKVSDIIEHSIFVRQVTGSWRGKREVTGPTPLIPEMH